MTSKRRSPAVIERQRARELAKITAVAREQAKARPTTFIEFLDVNGAIMGNDKRSKCARFSRQAAADHRKMDEFKKTHPMAVPARISGVGVFVFDVNNRSTLESSP
jgi:hypothetical protein